MPGLLCGYAKAMTGRLCRGHFVAEKKPGLIEIDDAKLEATLLVLDQLPQKGRPLREIIGYLMEGLNRALARGYSYKELSDVLAEQGVAIAESTLKQYMSELNKTKRSKVVRRKPGGTAEVTGIPAVSAREVAQDKPAVPVAVMSRASKKSESSARKFVEMPAEL